MIDDVIIEAMTGLIWVEMKNEKKVEVGSTVTSY